jgi:hypothetical protein
MFQEFTQEHQLTAIHVIQRNTTAPPIRIMSQQRFLKPALRVIRILPGVELRSIIPISLSIAERIQADGPAAMSVIPIQVTIPCFHAQTAAMRSRLRIRITAVFRIMSITVQIAIRVTQPDVRIRRNIWAISGVQNRQGWHLFY